MMHTIEVAAIRIDQSPGSSSSRVLAIIDKNRDLFVMVLRRSRVKLSKLGTMVQTLCWHEESSMLAAISNGTRTAVYTCGLPPLSVLRLSHGSTLYSTHIMLNLTWTHP